LQERIKIVEAYFTTKLVVQTQRQFRRDFPDRTLTTLQPDSLWTAVAARW